jgi:uncharacterized protein (DUF2336 family)
MIAHRFLHWIANAPAERRPEAAHALARAYLQSEVDDEIRSGMEAALTVLLDDPMSDIRFAIADALASSPRAPRHVILTLAGDQTSIATLVLARSPLIIDTELVDIVAAAAEPLQVAVASRPLVSGAVSAALAEVGERTAVETLLGNVGATIARISLRRIAERFGDEPAVRDMLLGRADLPAEIHQMLIRRLSDALGNLITVKAWVAEDRAATVTREACDRATVALAAESQSDELGPLVEHLRVTGQLTTALLLRAVCAGNIAFFEAALAVLARVPEARAASFVRGRIGGFRALYTKAGLPPLAFDAFAAALQTARRISSDGSPTDRYRFTRDMVDAVLARYRGITEGEINELTTMLRRFAADQARDAARDYVREASAA